VDAGELAGCVLTIDVFRAAGISPGSMKRPDQFDSLLLRVAQAETLDLLYVSTWHPPNVRSFEWFFDEIFEPILARLGLNLTVVGNIEHALKEQHRLHPQVLVTGTVETVRPLYAATKVVVLPVREGAG